MENIKPSEELQRVLERVHELVLQEASLRSLDWLGMFPNATPYHRIVVEGFADDLQRMAEYSVYAMRAGRKAIPGANSYEAAAVAGMAALVFWGQFGDRYGLSVAERQTACIVIHNGKLCVAIDQMPDAVRQGITLMMEYLRHLATAEPQEMHDPEEEPAIKEQKETIQ